jgi:hypothetical protein
MKQSRGDQVVIQIRKSFIVGHAIADVGPSTPECDSQIVRSKVKRSCGGDASQKAIISSKTAMHFMLVSALTMRKRSLAIRAIENVFSNGILASFQRIS